MDHEDGEGRAVVKRSNVIRKPLDKSEELSRKHLANALRYATILTFGLLLWVEHSKESR